MAVFNMQEVFHKMSSEQPMEQCEHWCVCQNYSNNCGWGFDDLGTWGWQGGFECITQDCEYDTRSRPHPAPDVIAEDETTNWTVEQIAEIDKRTRKAREEAQQRIDAVIKELEVAVKECETVKEATVDPEGKAFWRGCIAQAEEAITLLQAGEP